MRCVPPAMCATFVLDRQKNGNRPCEVAVHLARGGREFVGPGSSPHGRAGHDVDHGSEHLAATGWITPHPPTTGEPAVVALNLVVSRCGGITPHMGLTQLHRRCSGLADRPPASIWIPTCGAVPFPASYDGWGRSAHRCACLLDNLPVEGHRSSR